MDYQPINPLIYIQDAIFVANVENASMIGECHDNKADEATQLNRLYLLIEKLIKKAAKVHLQANGETPRQLGLFSTAENSGIKIKPECLNNITRLITNEFMFYTKRRLEPKEFAALFEKIFDFAQKQPENFHLILSSFAVRALNDKTMNVVAFVECGKNPKLHFIVKNYDSNFDPVYYSTSADGKKRTEFDNITISEDSEKKFPKIKIHNKKYKFSYNNVFEVTTVGGGTKLVAIDICYDHAEMVAKNNCTLFVKKSCGHSKTLLPIHICQVVTANYVTLEDKSKLEEKVVHVDPKNTLFHLKKNNRILEHKTIKSDLFFGTPHSQFYVTTPMQCSLLPEELLVPVKIHNEQIMASQSKKAYKKR